MSLSGRLPRSTNCVPMRASSARICWLSAGCATCSRSASAAEVEFFRKDDKGLQVSEVHCCVVERAVTANTLHDESSIGRQGPAEVIKTMWFYPVSCQPH